MRSGDIEWRDQNQETFAMAIDQSLIDEWKQRLARLKRVVEADSQRAWYAEIRVRVLEYCLSRYDNPALLRRAAASRQFMTTEHIGPVIGPISEFAGEPPKSPAEIRSLLLGIKEANNRTRNLPRPERLPRWEWRRQR